MGLYGGKDYVRISDFMGASERHLAHDRLLVVGGDAMGGVEARLSTPTRLPLVHLCASMARLLATDDLLVVVRL